MPPRSIVAITVAAMLLSACQTTSGASSNLVFSKQGLTTADFEADVDSCVLYVENKGASDSEQGAATAASLLLGGIVGAIAAHSAYEASKERLKNECMLQRGYSRVSLPDDLGIGFTGPNGQFDSFDATRELLAENRLQEVADWQITQRTSNIARLETFLKKYPDGYFAAEARYRYFELGGTGEAPDKEAVAVSTDAAAPESPVNTGTTGQQTAAVTPLPVISEEFPYDGIWRVRVVIDRTKQSATAPSICILSGNKSVKATIENGVLKFIVGQGASTIVEADVQKDGLITGRMATGGYAGDVSTFKANAKLSRITFPFRIGASCNGKFILSRVSSSIVASVLPDSPGAVSATQSKTATTLQAPPVASPDFPFDGVWNPSVSLSKISTLTYAPDICRKQLKLPRIVEIRKGVMTFKIGTNNPTLVEGLVQKNGIVNGVLDTRSWGGVTQRFATDVRETDLAIPFTMDRICKGTLTLSKRKHLDS